MLRGCGHWNDDEMKRVHWCHSKRPIPFTSTPTRFVATLPKAVRALELALKVVDAHSCAPLAGILVDVWHADEEGMVDFTTVYPGWYPGRLTTNMNDFFSATGDLDALQMTVVSAGKGYQAKHVLGLVGGETVAPPATWGGIKDGRSSPVLRF